MQILRNGMAAGDANQHRVAVGRLLQDVFARDRTDRARLVLDDDRLAPSLTELRGDQPGHDIDAAARRERHDQPHRPRRKIRRLGVCRKGQGGEREGERGNRAQKSAHPRLPSFCRRVVRAVTHQ